MDSINSLKYAFVFGLVGGPLHARKFEKNMSAAGYKHVSESAQADIIVAHSAGINIIPKDLKPKLVIYIGMTLDLDNPRQTQRRARKSMRSQEGRKSMALSRIRGAYYFIRQPLRSLRIIKSIGSTEPVIFPEAMTVFIANRYDPWPKHKSLNQLLEQEPWSFISLPGSHDDIWQNSGRYIEIINHYARLLT